MPLFGHKNKNSTGHNSKDVTRDVAGDSTIARQDYQNPQETAGTTAGPEQGQFNAANPQHGAPGNQAGMGPGATGPAMTGGHGHHHQHHQAAAVGAASLREQAMLHDREAQNFHAQSQELAEAERLEEQAREHRERAVAQGAHPHNKILGGNAAAQPGTTGQTGY